MLDQENFQPTPPAEPTESPESSESPAPSEPIPELLTKKKQAEILRNKAATLQKSLAAEPQQRREILIELGYLTSDSERTDAEIEQLVKIATLETMAQAEKMEEAEEELESDSSSDDDDEDEIKAVPNGEDDSKMTSAQLAEKMIKDDLKLAFQRIPAINNIIEKNGWEHLHLRTNREHQLVILIKQDGKLAPIMTWQGMELMEHQGLFDLVAYLEQTEHIK